MTAITIPFLGFGRKQSLLQCSSRSQPIGIICTLYSVSIIIGKIGNDLKSYGGQDGADKNHCRKVFFLGCNSITGDDPCNGQWQGSNRAAANQTEN